MRFIIFVLLISIKFMKKGFMLILLTIVMAACKSTSVTNTKLDDKTEQLLRGEWTLTSVNYPGSDYIKVTSFQLADSKCFVNSQWKFVSNNNKGSLALSDASCAAFESPITWFINKEGKFVMKVLNADGKAKKVKEGYVLSIKNASNSSFQLVDQISVGGKLTEVVYQFNKN